MALRSGSGDERLADVKGVSDESEGIIPLEDELHEGDGRIPGWLWIVAGSIALFAALAAPFQLFWSFGG